MQEHVAGRRGRQDRGYGEEGYGGAGALDWEVFVSRGAKVCVCVMGALDLPDAHAEAMMLAVADRGSGLIKAVMVL